MTYAPESDTDLLAEIQMFWIEPAFRVSVFSDFNISRIAVAVVRWLQVRPLRARQLEIRSQRPSCLLLEVS